MALTRKYLSAMGIEPEKIDEIISAHSESVDALKEQRDQYQASYKKEQEKNQETAKELEKAQKDLSDLQAEVEADKKDREGKDYDKLKKEFDEYKAEQENAKTKAAKEKAFSDFLADMKVSEKGVKLIKKYQHWEDIELDEEGKLKGASELRKAIKEDWGDYIQSKETKGADSNNPPGNNGRGGGKTVDEIMSIKNTAERQKAIAENAELFGIETE
jgi:chromosome segregation ATPase